MDREISKFGKMRLEEFAKCLTKNGPSRHTQMMCRSYGFSETLLNQIQLQWQKGSKAPVRDALELVHKCGAPVYEKDQVYYFE